MKRAALLLIWITIPSTAFAVSPRDHVSQAFTSKGAFLAFFVPDLESSVSWYTEKLGLEVVDRPPASETAKVAILEGGGLVVELIEHKDAAPRGKGAPGANGDTFSHGIFKAGVLVTDFESALATLTDRKVEIAFGPFPARGKQRANVLIRDNNGNLIQLFGE